MHSYCLRTSQWNVNSSTLKVSWCDLIECMSGSAALNQCEKQGLVETNQIQSSKGQTESNVASEEYWQAYRFQYFKRLSYLSARPTLSGLRAWASGRNLSSVEAASSRKDLLMDSPPSRPDRDNLYRPLHASCLTAGYKEKQRTSTKWW